MCQWPIWRYDMRRTGVGRIRVTLGEPRKVALACVGSTTPRLLFERCLVCLFADGATYDTGSRDILALPAPQRGS